MNQAINRLSARDIIGKNFTAKARRGYDPAEVDAYLMDVARQVDELNLEIDRLTNELVRQSFAQQLPPPVVEAPPVIAPPPVAAPVVAAVAAPVEDSDESLKLILKAAHRSAEQAISEARVRAEEIVAEAKFRAAEINRESDRKAFEAASRTQEELVRLDDELKRRRTELDGVRRAIEAEKDAVRDMANSLLVAIGDQKTPAGVAAQNGSIVDLTAAPPPKAAPEPVPVAAAPSATGGFFEGLEPYAPFPSES